MSNTKSIELDSQDSVVYYHEFSHAELSGISGYQSQGYDYIRHYCAGDAKPEIVLKKIMGVLNDVEKIVSIVLDATEDKLPAQAIARSNTEPPAMPKF